jgi:hypothetical protein
LSKFEFLKAVGAGSYGGTVSKAHAGGRALLLSRLYEGVLI